MCRMFRPPSVLTDSPTELYQHLPWTMLVALHSSGADPHSCGVLCGSLAGLSGSFGCATYELIVPGMILMKTQRTVAKKLVGIVVFLIGLAVMAISGFFIFQSIAEKISSHGVGGGGK